MHHLTFQLSQRDVCGLISAKSFPRDCKLRLSQQTPCERPAQTHALQAPFPGGSPILETQEDITRQRLGIEPKFIASEGVLEYQGLSHAVYAAKFRRSVQQGEVRQALQHAKRLASALSQQRVSDSTPEVTATSGAPADGPALSRQVAFKFAKELQGFHQPFFKLCLKKRKLESALEFARLLPPSPVLFTPLLKSCLDCGDLYAVMKAVEVRRSVGLPEDAFCYTALLKAASREGKPAKVDALFDQAWQQGVHGAPIFNVMISQHNAKEDFKASFTVFAKMLALDVEPDAVTMNLLVEAASFAGSLDKVNELYTQMKQFGPHPTSHTFVHLFNAFKRCHARDAQWIFEVFDDMEQLGIPAITQHFVTFLVASSDAVLSAKQIQLTIARSLAFCNAQGGDCSVYAALLKFCMGQDIPEKAVDIWRAIKKGKHSLNSWVFTALFTSCALNNCPDMRLVVTQASAAMEDQWRRLKSDGRAALQVLRGFTMSYNALLNAFAKMGMMTSAKEVFLKMQKQGPQPDIITYNTMLSGYAQAADTENAFAIFHGLCEVSSAADVKAFKLRPTLRTFGSLLHACARQGNASSAKQVMRLMRCAGVSPSAEIYTSLMHACIKQGSIENVQYAFKVFDQMKAEQIQPTAVTFGCMMNAGEDLGKAEHAFELYQQAYESNVMPTDECHNILINICAKNNRLEDALKFAQSLASRQDSHFQGKALNSLIRALAPDHLESSLQLLSSLRKLQLQVDRETLSVLIDACARASLIEEAHALYWELRRNGVGTTKEAGSHLIMALCGCGQASRALDIYKDMVLAELGGSASPSSTESSGRESTRVRTTKGSAPPLNNGSQITAAELLGLRQRVFLDTAKSPADVGQLHVEGSQRAKRRRRRAVFPHARAMAALVQSFASEGKLDTAFSLYRQLQRDSVGASAITLSDRYMWQALIEAACRQNHLHMALRVFDDWKAYCAAQTAMHRFDEDADKFLPRLSNGTLAFLHASCRANPELDWRVFDVCAAMRQQAERSSQAALPRPQKLSHHFAETID